MNIFKEMVLSVYSYKSYKEFLKNKKGKVFGFALMLMLLYFLVKIGIPCAESLITENIAAEIEESVPDFWLKHGKLEVEESFVYNEGNTYIHIDTEDFFHNNAKTRELLRDYTSVILMDSEKAIVKDGDEIGEFYFSELDFDFSKDDLMRWASVIYIGVVLFMVIAYLFMTALFFLGVLFVALMGMIAASCMNYKLTFGQLYLLGIYSRTLPLLIKAAVSFLPIDIPFFFIINFGLSLFIIIMAIQKMKEQQLQKPLEFTSQTGF